MMRKILSSANQQLTTGSPYWPERGKPSHQYDSLNADVNCEVAVIGGGITGSLIAYRMTSAGLSTVLVDQARFGSGSTSASTALISYEFDEMLSELVDQVGEHAAIRAYELCYAATATLKDLVHELEDPCDYENKVSVRISNHDADEASFKKEEQIRNRHGMKVEILDRKALRERFGVSAALGLISDNAAQIDPFRLTHRLTARAVKRGLQAFESTKITQFEGGKSGVRLTTANGKVIHARHVIFATGYASEKYIKTKSTKTTDFCFISNALKNEIKLGKCHLVENADHYLYLSTFGNRIMAGIEGKYFYHPAERSRYMAQKLKEVFAKLDEYLPDINLTVDFHWASTFVNSPDSLPYIATTPDLPGALFALGYGGNGIASSATIAPLLVDLITKGKSQDAKIFRLDR